MKKIFMTILSFTIVLSNIFNNKLISYADGKTTPDMALAYFEILDNIVNGNGTEENYGFGIFEPSEVFDEEIYNDIKDSYSFNVNSGLTYANLIDFDNNGKNELFYLYFTHEKEYVYGIYGFDNDKLAKIYSKKDKVERDFSLDLYEKDDKVYIRDSQFEKIYQEEGGFDTKTSENQISISNNDVYIENIMIYESIIGNITSTYKNSKDNEDVSITIKDANEKISSYEGESYIKISQFYPRLTNGECISNLDLSNNYKTTNIFMSKLLDLASTDLKFNEISNEINEKDKKNIEEFIYLFLQDCTRYYNYDYLNVDKGELLEYIFSLYNLNGETKHLTDIDDNLMYKSYHSLDDINKVTNYLFGIDFKMNKNDIYTFNNNTFKFKDGNIIRYGMDITNKGGILYKHDLSKIYDLKNNYYLIDIKENIESQDGDLENSLEKFYAIIKKTNDGKYQLIKMQNKPFQNEDGVKKYITGNDSGLNLSNTNKILISVMVSITFLLLMFLYIKFSKNSISKVIITVFIFISICSGILTYTILSSLNINNNNTEYNSKKNSIDTVNQLDTEIASENNSINTSEEEVLNTNINNKDNEVILKDDVNIIQEEEKSEITILLDELLNDYVYAVDTADASIMYKYVIKDGPAYKEYNTNIPSFYDKNISLNALDYEILDLVKQNNNYILTFKTNFEINNNGELFYQEEKMDFVIKKDNSSNKLLVNNLENWEVIKKEKI